MRRLSVLGMAASLALVAFSRGASAEVVINQPFASQPSDWTANTSNGGTISFAGGNLDVGGFAQSQNGSDNAFENYITPGSMTYSTSGSVRTGELDIAFDVTFNTTDTASGANRGGDNVPIFVLNGGGNRSIAEFDLGENGFFGSPEYQPSLSAGIFYGGDHTVSSSGSGNLVPTNEIEGQTYHIVLTSIITDGGPDTANPGNDNWTIDDTMTMSNSSYTFNFQDTQNGDAGYDPLDATLSFDLGAVAFTDGTPQPGFSGDINFANFNVTNPTPEPTSIALLGIVAGMSLIRRRRKISSN